MSEKKKVNNSRYWSTSTNSRDYFGISNYEVVGLPASEFKRAMTYMACSHFYRRFARKHSDGTAAFVAIG